MKLILTLLFLVCFGILACKDDPAPEPSNLAKPNECNFTSYPSIGNMSGDYLLIGSKNYSNDSIRSFIASVSQFDPDYHVRIEEFERYPNKITIAKLAETYNCPKMTMFINELKKYNIVSYVHYTMETDDCTWLGDPLGEECVNSYASRFMVQLYKESDTTVLDKKIEETGVKSREKYTDKLYLLTADKEAIGDPLFLVKYFNQTGLFQLADAEIVKFAVE